jgi:serine/threonine protein kinase
MHNTKKRRHYKKKPSRKNRKNHKKYTVVGGIDNVIDLAPGFYESIEAQNNNVDTKSFVDKLNSFTNKLNYLSKIETTDLRNYKNINVLGKGAFGKVEVWENKKDKKNSFAIKTQEYKDDIQKDGIMNEINILKEIKKLKGCDNHILCFNGVYDDMHNKKIYIATDYDTDYIILDKIIKELKSIIRYPIEQEIKQVYEKKKLNNIIYDSQKPEKAHFSLFFIKILNKIFKTILFLHENNIVHNDIKPENILCKIKFVKNKTIIDYKNIEEIEVKIIDFGLACKHSDSDPDNVMKKCNISSGSIIYMDPIKYMNKNDILKDNYIKCDYWSLGIIFKKLLCTNLQIDELWNTTKIKEETTKIKEEDKLNNFLEFKYYEYKTCQKCTPRHKPTKICEECDTINEDKYRSEYEIYSKFYKIIIDENNNFNELFNNHYKDGIENKKLREYVENVINNYKQKFNVLKTISGIYFDYAKQNNKPFAKIEDLLNPVLSERKIYTTYNETM